MQKITTFLWFDKEAEEAANFYCSLFKNSKITDVSRYGEAGPGEPGTAMTVSFELDGQAFIALNGGKQEWSFNPSVSLMVHCKDQAEVDHFWNGFLNSGGTPDKCSWLTDKYGLSWQIVPERLMELLSDSDRAKAQRVMQAMLQMTKIEVPELERAYAGV